MVRGFGDAVPAFMLIPIPRPRREMGSDQSQDTAPDQDAEQEAA